MDIFTLSSLQQLNLLRAASKRKIAFEVNYIRNG
jgi:hypothetical protein